MSDLRVDVAVVGAGLMGSATARELTQRGASVVLLEQYGIGHARGSSHGTSRIFRRVYADPFYVALTGHALPLWQEAERDTGVPLLRRTGGLDHGRYGDASALAATLGEAGVACEIVAAAQAEARWPGMRFPGPVLFHPEAGVIDADGAVAAFVRATLQRGGRVLTGTRLTGVEHSGSGVRLLTDGPIVSASAVVIASGAWLPEIAGSLGLALELPPLTVTQEQVFHFPLRDPRARWPTFVHTSARPFFGLASGADVPGAAFKVGQHHAGKVTTASSRDGEVDPAVRQRVVDHVAEWLPGLHPEPVAEATCLYTTTPDGDFVLDRVGPVVVASPCSGHGAKFAPLIGRLAADLALGTSGAPYPRFALRARAAPNRSVSADAGTANPRRPIRGNIVGA